jgi:heptosyltransferase II
MAGTNFCFSLICLMPQHLIVRLRNWVGDVVLSTPSLLALEQAGYTLSLVGKSWAKDLFGAYDWNILTKPNTLGESVTQLKQLKHNLIAQDSTFAQRMNALIYPTSFSSALEMRLAGLRAVGYGQEARGFLLKKRVKIVYGGHALSSYWNLTQHFLDDQQPPPQIIQLQVSAVDQAHADQVLARNNIAQDFICIVPFAGGTFEKLDKRWPHFDQLLDACVAAGYRVVVCPNPEEEPVARSQFSKATILSGVRLGPYLGILKRATLVVSNDTGPGHMAAAVGTPVISVLGPTKPEQWAPWGQNVKIIRESSTTWPTAAQVFATVQQLKRAA